MITTVDEFLDAVGGNTSANRHFKFKHLSAISMWRKRGSVPARYIFEAQKLAQMNGLTLAPQVFIPKKKPSKKKAA